MDSLFTIIELGLREWDKTKEGNKMHEETEADEIYNRPAHKALPVRGKSH